MFFVIRLINILTQLIVLLVIVKVVLSYFMSPYHPVRQAIDQVVEPMLAPIRRVIPPLGMIDLSPLVLLILVQVLSSVIVRLLLSLA